jgi:hypothetical protein
MVSFIFASASSFPFPHLQGRGDNDMRTLRAQVDDCVILTTAIHKKAPLQRFVSDKIGEIMDYENVLRESETQRLVGSSCQLLKVVAWSKVN